METPLLEIERLAKYTLEEVDLRIAHGAIVTLLGCSGSGKSTLLRCVAGIERPDRGEIRLTGRVVEGEKHFEPPEKRGVGLVFQNFALFPHLTVEQNICFGLRHLSGSEQERRLREQLVLHRIEELRGRYPHQISGGQQQRVALARALAPEPHLLLLDEPFSNLDEQVRHDLRIELRQIFKSVGITAIIVSHASNDAVTTSDFIAFLDRGRIAQMASPMEAYDHPRTRFVAQYLGRTNFLDGRREGAVWKTVMGDLPARGVAEGARTLSLRPEWIRLKRVEGGQRGDGVIERLESLGPQRFAEVRLHAGPMVWVNMVCDRTWQEGVEVRVTTECPGPLEAVEDC